MEHQNQDGSGEKNTAVRLNKEIVLPTTAIARRDFFIMSEVQE